MVENIYVTWLNICMKWLNICMKWLNIYIYIYIYIYFAKFLNAFVKPRNLNYIYNSNWVRQVTLPSLPSFGMMCLNSQLTVHIRS